MASVLSHYCCFVMLSPSRSIVKKRIKQWGMNAYMDLLKYDISCDLFMINFYFQV